LAQNAATVVAATVVAATVATVVQVFNPEFFYFDHTMKAKIKHA